jgi:4-carboxymuconolactone decarboxylase
MLIFALYRSFLICDTAVAPQQQMRPQMSSTRYDQGMATRRAVLGTAHVDRAEAAKTEMDTAFQALITESAWGTVWASQGIAQRERSMLTLALLAALGNFDEIPMHIRATARTGASRTDVIEAFQHVAIYAGVPRANHALKLAKQTYAEMEAEAAAQSPEEETPT